MSKNAYIANQQKKILQAANDGMRHGEQYAIDCVMIALHRQGWGYQRIKRLFDDVTEIADYYALATHPGMEQDVYQERMDAELRSFVDGNQDFSPFSDRYPLVKTVGYDRLPKNNR